MPRLFISFLFIASMLFPANAQESYPLRDPKTGEGRPSWWWSVFYNPVVVVCGTLHEVSKTNPDLTVSGNSDALKKYLGEGLGGAAAKGVHFIVTTIDVKEVLYIYPPYLKIDSKLRDLENHQRTSTPVLVQAEEFPSFSMVEGGNDTARMYYRVGNAKSEQIIILHYGEFFPFLGLILDEAVDSSAQAEIRKIIEYRRK